MAHIVHMIGGLGIGGAQSLLLTLAESMRGRPHRISVVNLHRTDWLADDLRALGVPVTTFPGKLYDMPRIVRICRLLRETDAAVIHTHLGDAHPVGALCGRLTGLPTVATIHTPQEDPPNNLRQSLRNGVERWALRHALDRIVAVGPRVGEVCAELYGGAKVTVIENAVRSLPSLSADERAAVRAEIMGDSDGGKSDGVLFIAVSRLSPEKAFPDLLTAFTRLLGDRPEAVLAIVGGGGLMTDLTERAAALGLGERVRFLGVRNDVARLLGASDVYVLSSIWEGLPVAMLEAMSVGIPVVVTSVGDIPTVLTPGSGVMVEPGNPDALAGAMRRMADDPALRAAMGAAGQRLVRERFGERRWTDQLCALYDAMLAERRPSRPILPAKALERLFQRHSS
ncbi:glycosyltransferase [Azospirillum sp. sgz302134]